MKTAVTAFLLMGVLVTCDAQRGGLVAFTNVSVVPMDSHRVLADYTVIVTNDRITAMRANGEMGALRLRGQTARATRGRDLH